MAGDIHKAAAAVERFVGDMAALGVKVTGFEVAGAQDRTALLAMMGDFLTFKAEAGDMALAGARITVRGNQHAN